MVAGRQQTAASVPIAHCSGSLVFPFILQSFERELEFVLRSGDLGGIVIIVFLPVALFKQS